MAQGASKTNPGPPSSLGEQHQERGGFLGGPNSPRMDGPSQAVLPTRSDCRVELVPTIAAFRTEAHRQPGSAAGELSTLWQGVLDIARKVDFIQGYSRRRS